MRYSAALVAASGCLVSGHMLLKTPTPYTVNNSPLDPSGSNFPCKNTFTGATATGPNVMTIGAPQTLAFTGGATHGGGSCQISLTTDSPPTKSTKWSVIHSIMGGCPTNTTDGNLSESDANMVDPSTFQYTIPDGISPGAYTLSLTWFNRVGNREMYQMCAPIQVNAASGKRSLPKKRATSFPDMFKANIGAAGSNCATVTGDLIFPDPGDSVEYDRAGGAANPSLVHPASGCASPTVAPAAGASSPPASGASSAAGAAPSLATAGAGGGSGAAPSGAPAASSPAAAAPSGAPAGSSAAGVAPSVAPVAASSPAAAAPSVAPVASSPAAAAPSVTPIASSPAAAAPTGGAGTTTGTSGGLTGACTTEGTWNCIGGSSFQRCASGTWTAVQPMAAGTTCQTGQSQQLFA